MNVSVADNSLPAVLNTSPPFSLFPRNATAPHPRRRSADVPTNAHNEIMTKGNAVPLKKKTSKTELLYNKTNSKYF